MFGILVKNKFLMIRNGFSKTTRVQKARKLLGLAGGGFLFWFMLQWVQDLFQILLQTDFWPGTVTQRIELFSGNITLIFNALFLFLFMGAISISVHYLYTSADLSLLLATPLSMTAIFSFKILESIFVNAGIFFLMGGAILLGQGLLISAPLHYYLIMLVVSGFFISLPTLLAIFLTLNLVRLLPPRRLRELSSAFTGLIGLGIWVLIQLFRIWLTKDPETTPRIFEYARVMQQFWTPGQLVGNFTRSFLNPLIPFPWLSTSLFIGGGILLFYFCLNFSIRQYLKTGTITHQTLLIEHSSARQKGTDRAHQPQLTRALLEKDWRLIIRNPQLLTQIVLMLAMILFVSIMLPVPAPISMVQMNENALGYFFLLFIIVSAQNASRLIPLENRAFWLLQMAPVSSRQILWRKFLLAFLINQIIALIILVVIKIYHQLALSSCLDLFILTLVVNLNATALGIFLGSHFPRFDWEHPKRMLTTTGSILLPVLSVLFFAILIFLELIFENYEFSFFSKASLVPLTLLIFGLILLITVLLRSEKKLNHIDPVF